MAHLILWLALPLLLAPILVAPERTRAAAGQLVIAGFGLAALRQGAGTLDLIDLRSIAAQSAHDGWFVGITAGVLLGGGCLFPDPANWRKAILGLPLAAALLWVALSAWLPLTVGAAIGLLPTAVLMRFRTPPDGGNVVAVERRPYPPASTVVLAAMTVGLAAFGPAVGAMGLLALLAWFDRQNEARRWFAVGISAAVASLGAWLWLALRIAESPLTGLGRFAADVPASPAAEVGLALLAIGWSLFLAAPWPLDRWRTAGILLPVLAFLTHLATVVATPDGIAHWQPLFTTGLVVLALVAAGLQGWEGAAPAMMLLAASRGGTTALAVAIAMGAVPLASRRFRHSRAWQVVVGVLMALTVSVIMRDQVLLAVLLAFGLAALANRVVAPVPAGVHL